MFFSWIGSNIQKITTQMWDSVSTSQRLRLTLRYLVTGDAHVTIAASFRMSPTTVRHFVKQAFPVIWEVFCCERGFLSPHCLKNCWRKYHYALNKDGIFQMNSVQLTLST